MDILSLSSVETDWLANPQEEAKILATNITTLTRKAPTQPLSAHTLKTFDAYILADMDTEGILSRLQRQCRLDTLNEVKIDSVQTVYCMCSDGHMLYLSGYNRTMSLEYQSEDEYDFTPKYTAEYRIVALNLLTGTESILYKGNAMIPSMDVVSIEGRKHIVFNEYACMSYVAGREENKSVKAVCVNMPYACYDLAVDKSKQYVNYTLMILRLHNIGFMYKGRYMLYEHKCIDIVNKYWYVYDDNKFYRGYCSYKDKLYGIRHLNNNYEIVELCIDEDQGDTSIPQTDNKILKYEVKNPIPLHLVLTRDGDHPDSAIMFEKYNNPTSTSLSPLSYSLHTTSTLFTLFVDYRLYSPLLDHAHILMKIINKEDGGIIDKLILFNARIMNRVIRVKEERYYSLYAIIYVQSKVSIVATINNKCHNIHEPVDLCPGYLAIGQLDRGRSVLAYFKKHNTIGFLHL